MASAIQTSSSFVRTRSSRIAANTGKPLQLSSASASNQTAHAISNLSLFLTNLRLLDLDLAEDWPGINRATFSAKDVAQGQKKRVQCVEWALYQLFLLWDAEETRNKLKPFFPPLDQVQSLNLRAALLRQLEHAKKNGILGRDAVIRKTMLDECKGERLEEVLAVFSSAVLKKVVGEARSGYPAAAEILALEHRGYSGERTELEVLTLVHRAALGKILRDKKAAHARYRDFADLLDLKERNIARRREQVDAAIKDSRTGGAKDAISNDVKLTVWRTVRNNWSGNERWMEFLLYGDTNTRRDGLLTAPFDKVWRRVQTGRLSELEDRSGGLQEQLDSRVKLQKERLEKWQGFQKKMFGNGAAPSPSKAGARAVSKPRGIDLGFGAHENLHLSRTSPRKLATQKTIGLTAEYSSLVGDMQAELASITKAQTQGGSFFDLTHPGPKKPSRQQLSVEASGEEAISELSELEEDLVQYDAMLSSKKLSAQRARPMLEHSVRASQSGSPGRIGQNDPPQAFSPIRQLRRSPSASPTRSPVRYSPVSAAVAHSPPTHRKAAASPSVPKPDSPEREDPPLSPTRELANQILDSVNNASPSPMKQARPRPRHTLSLAERTRLSMARGLPSSYDDEGDEAGPDVGGLSPRRHGRARKDSRGQAPSPSIVLATAAAAADEEAAAPDTPCPVREDLVARTRRSMAGFEAARQKAQLERRRSQRRSRQLPPPRHEGSYFPKVDEDGDNTLLAEELMREEDESTVFMSRPRVKTSPAPSRQRSVAAEER